MRSAAVLLSTTRCARRIVARHPQRASRRSSRAVAPSRIVDAGRASASRRTQGAIARLARRRRPAIPVSQGFVPARLH
jgi:hypothetical protein